MGHGHAEPGDPRIATSLRAAVEALRAALAGHDQERLEEVCAQAAALSDRAAVDASPRTRAQARGLRTALHLLATGRQDEVNDLVTGELWRSLPGNADVPAPEEDPPPAASGTREHIGTHLERMPAVATEPLV